MMFLGPIEQADQIRDAMMLAFPPEDGVRMVAVISLSLWVTEADGGVQVRTLLTSPSDELQDKLSELVPELVETTGAFVEAPE